MSLNTSASYVLKTAAVGTLRWSGGYLVDANNSIVITGAGL